MRTFRAEEIVRQQIEEASELIVVHKDGVAIYANLAACEALVPEALEQLCEQRGEVRVVRTDGCSRVVEVSSMPVVFEGAIATAVIARDVTTRAEEEAKLLRADRMNALGTLAAGIASEISDPLTAVVVNTEHVARRLRALLASGDKTTELAGLVDALAHALDGAGRVRQLARDLTALAHGSVERRGVVDLRGVLDVALQTLSHAIRGRARLVRYLRDVPPIEGNESRVAQLFLSLLLNAAQSIPEGSAATHEVRVSTHSDDLGRAVVEIADTGEGISAEVLPRVFDPFFTTKPGTGRGGLGLSIAHGTVRGMGGEMTVESAVGSGCIVRVVLPPAPGWISSHTATRCTVLVVDSDPSVAAALARALAEEHDVVVADGAPDAVRRVAAGEAFDAVVCDVSMHEMSGVDFYAEVLRHAPTLASQIVFLTCGALAPRARAFAESLGPRCLEKPPDMTKLRELIRKAARLKRSA